MNEIVNLSAMTPPTETDKTEEMDVGLVEFGIASDLTHGSCGRSGEPSYVKP